MGFTTTTSQIRAGSSTGDTGNETNSTPNCVTSVDRITNSTTGRTNDFTGRINVTVGSTDVLTPIGTTKDYAIEDTHEHGGRGELKIQK